MSWCWFKHDAETVENCTIFHSVKPFWLEIIWWFCMYILLLFIRINLGKLSFGIQNCHMYHIKDEEKCLIYTHKLYYFSFTVKTFILQGDVVQINKVYLNVFVKAPSVEQHSYSSQRFMFLKAFYPLKFKLSLSFCNLNPLPFILSSTETKKVVFLTFCSSLF